MRQTFDVREHNAMRLGNLSSFKAERVAYIEKSLRVVFRTNILISLAILGETAYSKKSLKKISVQFLLTTRAGLEDATRTTVGRGFLHLVIIISSDTPSHVTFVHVPEHATTY